VACIVPPIGKIDYARESKFFVLFLRSAQLAFPSGRHQPLSEGRTEGLVLQNSVHERF
jgi:hypothetical protein